MKITDTSRPRTDVQNEWYISALPSNIVMFVDRYNKKELLDNMKESLSVEKIILSLEKKISLEERKQPKKISFKDESKNKSPKDPFDLEGLEKVLKTICNEMVEIKKKLLGKIPRGG